MVEICSACYSDDGDNIPSVANCNTCNKALCEDHCNIHKKKGHVVDEPQPEEEFQIVFDNEDLTKISNEEQEQINVLCNNLLETVSKTEERINSYNIVTRKITSTMCSPLIKKMRREIQELRTKGASYCNVYLVGNTGSAKTTTFKTLLGKPVTKEEVTETSMIADTKGPELQKCESLLCNIIDTAGYADESTKDNANAVFKTCKEYPPDIILFCFTSQTVKESTNFKTIFNKCIELSKKGISPAPIIPVLTKIDELWMDNTFTEDEIIRLAKKTFKKSSDNWKHLFKTFMKIPPKNQNQEQMSDSETIDYMADRVVYCCFKPYKGGNQFKRRRVGLKLLLESINTTLSETSIKQLRINNESLFKIKRRNIASAVISSFSAMNAAVSLVPLIDIPITYFLTDQMLELLSCFSSNQAKNVGSFKVANIVTFLSMNAARVGALMTAFALEVSGIVSFGIGTAIGLGAGVVVGSTSTAAIGVVAYNYFIEPFLNDIQSNSVNVRNVTSMASGVDNLVIIEDYSKINNFLIKKNNELDLVQSILPSYNIISIDTSTVPTKKYLFIDSTKTHVMSEFTSLDTYGFISPRLISVNRYNDGIAVCDKNGDNYFIHEFSKEYVFKRKLNVPTEMKPKFMLWRQYLIETEFWKSDKVVNEIVLGDRDGNIFSLQTDSVTWDRKSIGLTNLIGMSILRSGLIVCADTTSVYVIGRSCEGNVLRTVCKFDLSKDGYEIKSLVCVNDSIYVTNGTGNLKIIASKK